MSPSPESAADPLGNRDSHPGGGLAYLYTVHTTNHITRGET